MLVKFFIKSAALTFCGVISFINFTGIAAAQGTTARIDGTVQDSTGAVIAGARVTIVEKRTQASSATSSNSSGNFVFTTVQPGVYNLTVEASGFRREEIKDLEMTAGGTSNEIVKLQVGQASESISVEANTAQVQTTDSTVSQVINLKEVDGLPTLGRTPLTFAILQPGVQIDVRAGQDSSYSHINGLRQGSNNSVLDGIDVNDSVTPRLGLSLTAVDNDSVSEIRVITAGGNAEYGRNAGGQVELVTRSGTNQYHGALFDYLRNTDLNANDFFVNQTGGKIPVLIQNIYGGSFGAPIRKNKTFIFGNFQGRRTDQQVVHERTVPTATARAGIFEYKDSSGNIQQYNIAANDPNHIGIDPSVAKLLALYPLPNNFNVGDGLNTAGFSFNNPVPSLEDQFTIRGDHRINDNMLLFLRWSWERNSSIDNLNSADATFPGQVQGTQGGHRWGFSAGYTWTINPTLVNDFRAGHQSATVEFLRPNRPDGPALSFNSFTNIQYTSFAQGRNSPVDDYTDTITKVRGNHTFKAGANLRFTDQYGYNYSGVYPTYSTTNANGATVPSTVGPVGLTATQLTTFQNLYNDVLGRISTVTETYYSNLQSFQAAGTPRVRNFLWNESGYFLQDDWRVNRKLTLNIGLRYEYYGVPHEKNGLQGTISDASMLNGVSQLDGLAISKSTQWYNKDLNNFAPRFGFAYDPFGNGKTAIRGFYGVFYDRPVGAVISLTDGNTPGFSSGLTSFPTNATYAQLPPPPAQPASPVLSPADTRSTSIVVFNPNLRTGYVHSYNFNIQQQLPGGEVLQVGYVGNRGVKLFFDQDVNQPRLNSDFVNSFQQMQAFVANSANVVPASNFFARVYGSGAAAVSALGTTNFAQGNVGTIINTLDVGSGLAKAQAAGISNFYFRNYPQFNQVIVGNNDGRSYYDSLQVTLRKRGKTWSVLANYTYSRSEDNISAEGNGFTTPINNYNLALNKAKSDFDRPNSFNASVIYTLPVGRGQRFAGNMPRVLDALAGGWNVSAIIIDQSGQPFSVSSQHTTLPVSGVGNTYANYSGTNTNIGSVQETGSGVVFFTPTQIAEFSNPGAFSLGNSGRNVFRNPSFNEVDASLYKNFKITERHVVTFRAEAYNLFNHPNFGLSSANLNINNPSTFGAFSSTLGTQTGGSSARTMQLALRYDF